MTNLRYNFALAIKHRWVFAVLMFAFMIASAVTKNRDLLYTSYIYNATWAILLISKSLGYGYIPRSLR
jgi:hypothetical protein